MLSLQQRLCKLVGDAFGAAGYEPQAGKATVSDRPDLAHYQCNGALAAAKAHRKKPRDIASEVVARLPVGGAEDLLGKVSIAGPGFINLEIADAALVTHLAAAARAPRFGIEAPEHPLKVVIDYGGPNVAKPMHVGHLRSAILGESLKRIGRFLGHRVVGDVHLGDWGLQMGMLISELERRSPTLPYFDAGCSGPYPSAPPVTLDDLQEIYPAATSHAKANPEALEAARLATLELQRGRPGYRALWRHFVDLSVTALRADYAELGVSFDLWLGESDAQPRIPGLVERLRDAGLARQSEGALVVDISVEGEGRELPPLMLLKSDGAVLYGTTDLATLEQRVAELGAELVLYVTDSRQSDHFEQVFRGARKTGVAPPSVGLEHIGFGTMNGKDGKPFKTREGGVMRLRDLMDMVTAKALERMAEAELAKDYGEAERRETARKVGMAALKFADLANQRTKDYVFDLERFSSFEGRTGPYLLYTAVRTRSILRKAADQGLATGPLAAPSSDVERALLLELAKLPEVVDDAFAARAPHPIADYAFTLATAFNRFYRDHHILHEPDPAQQRSWLALSALSADVLCTALDLLGIEVPERM